MNILLIIVDCLRYDRVAVEHMPWLYRWGQNNVWFENHWVSSHCTDPSITHMLSGKHPDELRLYSMMFADKKYCIPRGTVMLPQIAKERGYSTAMITNLGRWYKWYADRYVDTRNKPRGFDFAQARRLVSELPEPWFIVLHNADMHANYAGGSYDSAAEYVDGQIRPLIRAAELKGAAVFVTADHGEGLGQSGPDGHEILQHGYGLWPFLTHVPLLASAPTEWAWSKSVTNLVSNDAVYDLIAHIFAGARTGTTIVDTHVFQAGATPNVFHRGVVLPDGRQFVRATYKDGHHERYFVGGEWDAQEAMDAEYAVIKHCERHGLDYGELAMDETLVIERLKGLGYFDG